MRESITPYGRLVVGAKEELFARVVSLAAAEQKRTGSKRFSWALSGGSTPQDWCRWVVQQRALSAELVERTEFTVSDERVVPLDDAASNFGNADRWLWAPLEVPAEHRHPWPVDLPAKEAAAAYQQAWQSWAGAGKSYDVCMLGLGDDAHTASFFPGTPLFEDDGGQAFAAVDAGAKGWRLTISPSGLRTCGAIIVLTLGANKAEALRRVFRTEEPWSDAPAKILSTASDRVTWLVDEAAAAKV